MSQEDVKEKKGRFPGVFIQHTHFAVRQILVWALEIQNKQRPCSSGFPFAEGTLLILHGVCYCLVVRLGSCHAHPLSPGQPFSVSQSNMCIPPCWQSTQLRGLM